jgi:flagellin-like protein
MYKLNKPQKSTIKRIFRKSKAVSPVIATLVLIVVAIVGAISVGLIMSRVSTDTAGQANVQNAVGNSQQNLIVGGSSTIAPVVLAAIPDIQSQEHIDVTYVTSSSGQGMEGVMINALDVGAASSYPAVTSGQTYASSSYPGVNLVATLIGGSGETIIENAGNGLNNGFLVDSAGNACYGITAAALADIYQAPGSAAVTAGYAGKFVINNPTPTTGGCVTGYLTSTNIVLCETANEAADCTVPAAATYSVPITVAYRSDSSGTQDTFAAYVKDASGVTTFSDANFFVGAGESGNQGMLSYVQSCTATAPCIGFTDLGFADGAAVGAASSTITDGVAIAEAFSSLTSTVTLSGSTTPVGPVTAFTDTTPSATNYPLASGIGVSVSRISAQILEGLQQTGASIFPDNGATVGSTLVRTFYFVTNGAPNTTEENFISYFTSSSATSEALWTSNGFFNLYQINSGA